MNFHFEIVETEKFDIFLREFDKKTNDLPAKLVIFSSNQFGCRHKCQKGPAVVASSSIPAVICVAYPSKQQENLSWH